MVKRGGGWPPVVKSRSVTCQNLCLDGHCSRRAQYFIPRNQKHIAIGGFYLLYQFWIFNDKLSTGRRVSMRFNMLWNIDISHDLIVSAITNGKAAFR